MRLLDLKYGAYLNVPTGFAFDTSEARARLAPAGVELTPIGQYLHRLIAYGERSDWGEHRRTRTEFWVSPNWRLSMAAPTAQTTESG